MKHLYYCFMTCTWILNVLECEDFLKEVLNPGIFGVISIAAAHGI